MSVPDEVARILSGPAQLGGVEQAFPLLTLDEHGFPHVALLSRAEMGVTGDGGAVVVVVASTRTRANLAARQRATIIAVSETTAHYLKLRVGRSVEDEGRLAAVLHPVEHKADSLGIPLGPLSFLASEEIARLERWDVSARLLRSLGVDRETS